MWPNCLVLQIRKGLPERLSNPKHLGSASDSLARDGPCSRVSLRPHRLFIKQQISLKGTASSAAVI